nr:RlpA-like double-psi beta-barrel domain-containing protein [Tanacetum cinerariifolium]
RPDHNVDCPPPTCQLQVFKSLCKSIGLRSVIRIDHQELKKVIWYVLHNSPEIDTYRAKFKIRDERRTTHNSGICSPGPGEEMYYGQLKQILEFLYLSFKTVLFRVKWFDTSNKGHGKSIDVYAPPDIIDVVDEDDDIIDEEDPIPHDLADSDDEDLVNLDIDDGVNVVNSSEEED